MVALDNHIILSNDVIQKNQKNTTILSNNSESPINVDVLIEDRNSTYKENVASETLNSTTYQPSITELNDKFMTMLKSEITPLLLSVIRVDDFEFGTKGASVRIVEDQLKTNPSVVNQWLNELYLKAFAEKDSSLLIGILKIVEAIEHDSIRDNGRLYAMCAFSHRDLEVKELGIRILENKCNSENYWILRNIHTDTPWLNEYIQQVIKDFEEELCL